MLFKYLVVSDIHLGHNVNRTPYIVDNLRKFFRDYYKDISNVQAIFIAGDIFDKLLPNSSGDYLLATEWLTELIVYCKSNKTKLRILEGTPSHDWKQAKVISTIISKLGIEIDFKYIDTLCIEYMKDVEKYILYVPDEYKQDANDTLKEVKEKLKELSIDQVDIAIMHGAFKYQLPMVNLISSHDESSYLELVKYYINIGHIHTPSVFERILAQGSFDRLAHGEEENKGAMLVTISDVDSTYKFLVNKNSMIFKTIKFEDEEIDVICNKVRNELNKLPLYSSIKIIANNEDYLHKSINILAKEYPGYRIKAEKIKKNTESKHLIKQEIIANSIVIKPDNIKELLMEEIKKYNLNNTEMELLLQELDEAL